jgi:hypothetical protein
MATVEERFASATADVRRAIAAVESRAVGYTVDEATGQVEWFTGRSIIAIERGELWRLHGQWLRATTLAQREKLARNAEALAEKMTKPATGCTRDAGLIDVQTPGSIRAEMDTVDGIVHQLDGDVTASHVEDVFKQAWRAFVEEWSRFYKEHLGWLDRLWYSAYEKTVEYRKRALAWRDKFIALGGKASAPVDQVPQTAADRVSAIGKALLWGGGIFAAYRLATELIQRNRKAQSSARNGLNRGLVRVAERNAPSYPMCPVCHRYQRLDERGRLARHEYPSGGMCPGEGRRPLWPHGRPKGSA